jgi:hypothetical protein
MMEYAMEIPFINHDTYKVLKDTVDHIRERVGSHCAMEIHFLDLLRIEDIVKKYEEQNVHP